MIPLAAFGWQRVDHRPAWVMSILVTSESKDEARARADERRAVNDLLRRIERPRIAIDLHDEGQRRTGDGTTFEAQRTVVIRSEDEAPLTAVKLAAKAVPETTMIAEPRRATHISDFALAFVLVAMLLTLATLERSGLSDADPFIIDAPRVVLLLLGLGFLAAGAVVIGNVWNASLIPFVAVAAAPIALWFTRARTYWTRDPALRPRYTVFASLAGLVAAAWLARWLGVFA
ncbi:MAG: hypothetical protein M3169_12385 [Candidatus Eremiobacteraeota bacterium]|nr:hypothetical protein [Candidatus Eremiobacteraeota bacterium]